MRLDHCGLMGGAAERNFTIVTSSSCSILTRVSLVGDWLCISTGIVIVYIYAPKELEAIRQRRMQELMAHRGVANPQNAGQQKAQEEAKQEAEERWQMMLAQILSSEARERHNH
uniref:Uncharacterized protein n=1 Tax=Oryza meridionalis TaxID=40149 RepID=A0A0E0C3I6_9ORYZ